MGYVMAILFLSGQSQYKQFPTLESCRAELLQAVDNGQYKTMKFAECAKIHNEDL